MHADNGSGAMFDAIAKRYDLLNAITSLGQDRRWRRQAVRQLRPSDRIVLDLAAGTLDVSVDVRRRFSGSSVVAVDPSRRMLLAGRHKLTDLARRDEVAVLTGRAECLPLADSSVDAAIVAFGVRNFPDRAVALAEVRRVLRPSGRLIILELTLPRDGLPATAARLYVHRVVPFIGGLMSRRGAYAYLPRSMACFPCANEFVVELTSAGFAVESVTRFMAGVCHLFVCARGQKEACCGGA
jgi:demethylmenaquinone methyltransferase/2-methoxy-6-polyprenyl-1,4-benzoquinol methylase